MARPAPRRLVHRFLRGQGTPAAADATAAEPLAQPHAHAHSTRTPRGRPRPERLTETALDPPPQSAVGAVLALFVTMTDKPDLFQFLSDVAINGP